MTRSNLQTMLDDYSGKHQKKILKTCEPFFQTFGLNHFFHQSISHDGLFHGIGTNLDFMHYYIDQNMQESNPFVTESEKVRSGIYSFNSVDSEEFQKTLQLGKEKHNIKHTLLIVENDFHSCNQYGFCISPGHAASESLLINELSLVKVFINYFNQEMSSCLEALKTNPVRISKKNRFLSNIFPEMHLDYFQKISLLSKMKTPKHILSPPKLSKREIQCLKLYLKGKSSTEIGEDLELTKRTVEFYFENIKNKLSCYKKSDLIALLNQMRNFGLYTELFQ